MTITSHPLGYWYLADAFPAGLPTLGNLTLDAATEKLAFMGYCYIAGRAASKTISSAGGAIQFRLAGTTFANGGSTLDIGIQDISSAAGPPARPDGTFDVLTTLTGSGGGGGLTGNAWNTISMTSGSKTISHGDLIAIVFDMTARAGADSVVINGMAEPGTARVIQPVATQFLAGAWGGAGGFTPNAVITFDDGILGFIDGLPPTNSTAPGGDVYSDATNPDERGMMFEVPWDCKVDAFLVNIRAGVTDANSDYTAKLYSDPLGTPSLLASKAVDGAQRIDGGGGRWDVLTLSSEISLTKNTSYGIAILATGSQIIVLSTISIAAAAHLVFYSGGTTRAKITRNNSTGAFSAESPALTQYQVGVRISSFVESEGGEGGTVTTAFGVFGTLSAPGNPTGY